MKPDTLDKVCILISRATDAEADAIANALRARSSMLRHQKQSIALSTIRAGDRVRLVSIRPQYLLGTRATVINRRQTKFLIELDENADPRAIRRFRGRRVVCPATSLEKIE